MISSISEKCLLFGGYLILLTVFALTYPPKYLNKKLLAELAIISIPSLIMIGAEDSLTYYLSSIVLSFCPFLMTIINPILQKHSRSFLYCGLGYTVCLCCGLVFKALNLPELSLYLILTAAMIRMGLFPFQLWLRRSALRFSLQSVILYYLTYPSISLFVETRTWNLAIPTIFGLMASITALYGAINGFFQQRLRTSFYFLLLSFLGAIGIGVTMTPLSIPPEGIILFWFSAGLTLAGFGIIIEMIETRVGEISLNQARGVGSLLPSLGAIFLLFGLGSVGFPGMCAFFSEEIMLDGFAKMSLWTAFPILLSLSINGITILKWYFHIFCGESLAIHQKYAFLARKKFALAILLFLILITGLFPNILLVLSK